MNYTDAHVTIPGLTLIALLLLAGSFAAAFNAFSGARARWIVGSQSHPLVVGYLLLNLVGWYVATFVVKPNQLVREETLHRPQHRAHPSGLRP